MIHKGGSAPRIKGDAFERRVKNVLISHGFFCVRQPRSAFPDLIAAYKQDNHPVLYFIECKMGKYISSGERTALLQLAKAFCGTPLIAYKGLDKKIYFCDLAYDLYNLLERFK